MSVLVIGADEITPIKAVLHDLGAEKIEHWDARNENRVNSFLNHNTMKTIKTQAKKRNIPIVCAKRSVSCVFCEYCKVFGLDKEFGCKE